MSRRRNRVVNTLGLSSEPLSPTKTTPGYFTMKELREQDARAETERQAAAQREAEEKLTAPLRELESEIKIAARENSEKVRKFFSLPLSSMAGFLAHESPTDHAGNYPTRTGNRDQKQEFETYKTFRADLTSRGIELSTDGWNRLGSYISSLATNRGILVDVAAWKQALKRLVNLGVFSSASGELINYQPEPEPVRQSVVTAVNPHAESEPTLDSVLEANSIESREGYKRIKAAVELDVYGEWEATFNQFVTAVRDQFGAAMNQDEMNALGRLVLARNLNPRLLHSWSKAREMAVRAGYLRNIFMTTDEALAWDVDRGIVKTNTFEERQAFNRRVAQIHKGIPVLS